MDREELNARFGVTEEQLDEWADAWERGDPPGKPVGPIYIGHPSWEQLQDKTEYPEGKAPLVMGLGRPPKFGSTMQPVTFKETEEQIERINARSLQLGFTSRSDYLRHLVAQDLANA